MGDSLFHSSWRMRATRAALNSQDTRSWEICPDFRNFSTSVFDFITIQYDILKAGLEFVILKKKKKKETQQAWPPNLGALCVD